MDYQEKLQRHASKEIDLYWSDFQKSDDYAALMQDPDFRKVPPKEIRAILVTFFAASFKNLRSTIQTLSAESVSIALETTLQQVNDDDRRRSEAIAVASELIKAMMIWLIRTKRVKLTIVDFIDALMGALLTTTYVLGLVEDGELASPMADDSDGRDIGFDPAGDLDVDSESMSILVDQLMVFFDSKAWHHLPEATQDEEFFGAVIFFLIHTIQAMFGHEPKEWTSQDIGAALLLLLRDTKLVPPDKQEGLGQSLAIFIKSTASTHLWTATQMKSLADTAQNQIKEALTKKPVPRKGHAKTAGHADSDQIIPMAEWQKNKRQKRQR
ncbi:MULTISPECIES: hypothetical protein [Lacticaseibacillus]|jgi:hypothetical protein|uniref:Mebrane protein n=2 Tax=Lacticaseibacillus TaxID=2759736 RepID=A0AAD1ERN3_LACCA|nr:MULTISPECIES: hypothetical protein [Lacticaseibacillus]HAJ53184.1 hypothetical protein [Lactobacillus sp.]MBI6597753.1 hypothetical protein [Lacticaseibacillus casei]MBO1481436.1 hypothetical protein [Lacticaseibacillus casei]MBO2416716.1 hypothetical protein [Lacticaseibacillus casei]MCK2081153.1 hypothetical protein [Lacticaseibacillus casei]